MESDVCRFLSKVSTVLPKKKITYIKRYGSVSRAKLRAAPRQNCLLYAKRRIDRSFDYRILNND